MSTKNTNNLKTLRTRFEVEYSFDGFAIYSTLHATTKTYRQADTECRRCAKKYKGAAVRIVEIKAEVISASISTPEQAANAAFTRRRNRNLQSK